VVIVSERYFAFAGRDGSLLEGDMPRVPGLFMRVPLLRGLARLAMSFSPLMQRGGVAGQRERILLTAVVAVGALFLGLTVLIVVTKGWREGRDRWRAALSPGLAERLAAADRREATGLRSGTLAGDGRP